MTSRDVALTISSEYITKDNFQSRKSLRRVWNQLPRCQRNLIIFVFTALCLTLFLFIPGERRTTQAPNFDKLPLADKPQISETSFLEKTPLINSAIDKNDDIDKRGNGESIEQPETRRNFRSFIQNDQIVGRTLGNVVNNNIEEPLHDLISSEDKNNLGGDTAAIKNAIIDVRRISELSIAEHIANMKAPRPVKQHFHGATNDRRLTVIAAFKHSWYSYKKYAWGHDNLKPISKRPYDWFKMGLTIIDSLDTLIIMGLEDEFLEARDWVANDFELDVKGDVNLFEVTIRVLGGLLSAYHLSGDAIFLEKSIELGNRLLPSFQSPSGIPYSDVNLLSLTANSPKWSPDSSTSEVTTIQLEFRDLSRSSNIPIFEQVANRVNTKIHVLKKPHGLVPIFINANTGKFRESSTISLGARGDSYYEYLLKQWLQTGRKSNDTLINDYKRAVEGIRSQLVRRTPRENLTYIGELKSGKNFEPKMDHLVCYFPGTLLLGYHYGMPSFHYTLATELFETCLKTYTKQPTGLAPEITHFALSEHEKDDTYVKPNDAHNLLRPEFVESLYYFYTLTGNQTYQDIGWRIFESFNNYTKVEDGYTSIGDVRHTLDRKYRDNMESYWFSETLKYLYLLFSDNRKEIDLEKWVFNTEGHPLPIRRE